MTKVKVSYLSEDALRAQDEAYLASLPKPKPAPPPPSLEPEKKRPPKLSKDEEILREKWSRLLEMVSKDRSESLKTFWERESSTINSPDALIPEWAGEKRSTLLHLAAEAGSENVTRWLLEEARADPTIPVPHAKAGDPEEEDQGHASDASDAPASLPTGSHRTAYDLARSRAIRDVFRRCAADHPDWWDWFGTAHVPSALSKQMEDERDEKKKIRRKGLKDRVREREAKDREKVRDHPPPAPIKEALVKKEPPSTSTSRKLGGATGAAEGVAGLTPEMRAKVDRERRARAAEARMKALGTQ